MKRVIKIFAFATLLALTLFIWSRFAKAQIPPWLQTYTWSLVFQPSTLESGRALMWTFQGQVKAEVHFKQPFFGRPACFAQLETEIRTPVGWSRARAVSEPPFDSVALIVEPPAPLIDAGPIYVSYICAGPVDRAGVWIHNFDGMFSPF